MIKPPPFFSKAMNHDTQHEVTSKHRASAYNWLCFTEKPAFEHSDPKLEYYTPTLLNEESPLRKGSQTLGYQTKST